MSFGSSEDWHTREEKALPILKHAYDSGLNTWDTVRLLTLCNIVLGVTQ